MPKHELFNIPIGSIDKFQLNIVTENQRSPSADMRFVKDKTLVSFRPQTVMLNLIKLAKYLTALCAHYVYDE